MNKKDAQQITFEQIWPCLELIIQLISVNLGQVAGYSLPGTGDRVVNKTK